MADGGLLDMLQGIPEAAGNLLTGLGAEPLALARQGWGQLMTGELPRESSEAADDVRNALTYQPRTQWGAAALQTLGHGIDSVSNAYIPGVTEAARSATNLANTIGGDPYTGAGLLAAATYALPGGPESRLEREARPAPFPQYAREYPPIATPLNEINEKGEPYLARGPSPETAAFMKTRLAIQKDLDAGNYTPYFNVEDRYDANPANYSVAGNTITDALPAKQATIDKHTAAIATPEARARLNAAYDAGIASGGHDRWYQMGQLEDAFIKELGPELGRRAFKQRFADAMAATTAGADPQTNLMSAAYGNYLDTHNMPIPESSALMPVPTRGKELSQNMEQYGNLLQRGEIPVSQPKRHNFSRNFVGDSGPSTIDKQMTDLITPGQSAPKDNQYGIYENLLAQEAAARGVAPRDFQDVAWGGKKFTNTGGRYQGKPMIQHVNEAIERTSRLTGQSPQDVLKGFIRGQIPLYGLAGIMAGGGLLNTTGDTDD